jgi:CHAD domain-containing protein
VGSSPNIKGSSAGQRIAKPKLGLRSWMERVLEECNRADKNFDADAVHDLRVALRRCRSLADGLIVLDSDSSWKDMKKAGKKVFQALGDLRDMQVMEAWIKKLTAKLGENSRESAGGNAGVVIGDGAEAGVPAAVILLSHVKGREENCIQLARKDLAQFDRKQWRQWSRTLPQRASRVRLGSLVYLHLALEKWNEAYDLHKRALRTRSTIGWHELRIGIKHFRYTVENFLPEQHAKWGDDLKELQDLLGEVHDLDVLWAAVANLEVNAFPDVESRRRWRAKLTSERNQRLASYREKMAGRRSLWHVWREELPSGSQLRAATLSRLRTWAGFLDTNFAHSQLVAQVSLQLYDALRKDGLVSAGRVTSNFESTSEMRSDGSNVDALRRPESSNFGPRAILQSAAFMHGVGRAKGEKNYQKESYRMIRNMTRPLGLNARELELAATVARYHRGGLPRLRGKVMHRLDMSDRATASLLGGALRLSVALEAGNSSNKNRRAPLNAGSPIGQHALLARRVEIHLQQGCVLLRVEGYSALDETAESVAAARHLLETVLRRPIIVRPLRRTAGRLKPELRTATSATGKSIEGEAQKRIDDTGNSKSSKNDPKAA